MNSKFTRVGVIGYNGGMNFYQESLTEVLHEVKSGGQGLSAREAKRRLEEVGGNELLVKGEPIWKKILEPFADVMVVVLLGAAVIGCWQKEYLDAVIIVAVILINAVINWVQRFSTERILRTLRQKESANARVYREGAVTEIPVRELVPGDVMILSEGQKIPADARLLEVNDFYTDEAILTGESSSRHKTVTVLYGKKEIYEQKNMVFSGTFVMMGMAKAVVVATGNQTVFGQLASLIASEPLSSPMQEKISRLIRQIVGVILVIALLTFGLTLFRGLTWMESLRFVISLAVSAVPEGLPIAVTVILAIGMKRLAAKKALVRQMQAIENLGLVTVIATDKTGTLTKNQLRVQEIWAPKTQEAELTTEIGRAINHTQGVSSDPLDEALKIWRATFKLKMEKWRLSQALPFDYSQAQSGNIFESGGQRLAYIKGAPERIFARVQLKETDRVVMEERFHAWTSQGYRVIAVAKVAVGKKVTKLKQLPAQAWQLVALVAIADELRLGVAKAVAQAEQAGVKVKMITGDHFETAWQIAAKIRIAESREQVYNCRTFENLSATKRHKIVAETRVFSRVLPDIKYQILKELNKSEITAMTGDGVNDVPALSRAHVAVAMGSGAQIAKEASDIVLLDDNFKTIVTALHEGRVIVANIRRMLIYLLSTNTGEVLVTVLALLLGLPLPVLAVQILWINLVTDTLMVIPLGLEAGEKGIMKKPPEKVDAPILPWLLLQRVILIAVSIAILVLVLYSYFIQVYSLEVARTLAFMALIVTQLSSAFSLRSVESSWWQSLKQKNWSFWGALLVTIILQILVFMTPFGQALHVVAVPLEAALLTMVVGALGPLLMVEGHKRINHE